MNLSHFNLSLFLNETIYPDLNPILHLLNLSNDAGANLRTLLREEYNGCKNEQTRSKMMKEYAVQMASLDGIVIRNKYDANILYEG